MASTTSSTQAEHWNGRGGDAWVRRQETLDQVVRPLGEVALAAAAVSPGDAVLDVGCGCGDTTLAVAARAGKAGRVLGVDVSGPMLGRARERLSAREGASAPVELVLADAATHALPAASFDVLVSRFGVMFFEDPDAAFANLARALRPGGRLAFVCWRALAENRWAALPLRAIGSVVTLPPPPPPAAPGPFAFADASRVTRILEGAGFVDVRVTPHDAEVPLGPTGPGTRDEDVLDYVLEVGPAARALAELDAPTKAEAVAALARALAELPRRDAGVWLPAAIWLVTARRAG